MRGEERILDPLVLVETNKIVELVKTLISKPSVSGQEHELVDWLENYFKYIGLTGVKRLPVEESGDTLIGWVRGKTAGPTVMLNFHVDTFNAFEGWETEPFVPVVKNRRVYGLGAHDMKGGTACLLTRARICVTGISGGGTDILVPEFAELWIDRHILPNQTVEGAALQIHEIIRKSWVTSKYKLTWDERPTPAPTSYITPEDSELVQTVSRNLAELLGMKVSYTIEISVADTNHVAVHGGVPTVILGPDGGNTCEANEYVDIASLPVVTKTLIKSVLDLLSH